MNAAYVYLQLYRLFDKSTPISADCGELCSKACCGGDDDAGMYLFPGEEKVFKLLSPSWIKLEKSDFTYSYNGQEYTLFFASCSGDCDRYERPLACRIFPLTPYVTDEGNLTVIIDPRAKRLCPLSRGFILEDFNADFLKNVNNAFKLLMKNPGFRAFMSEYSKYIDGFSRFWK